MELIIGGAYQGKLEYARENLGVKTHHECDIAKTDIDFSCGCVTHIERFVLACMRAGISASEYIDAHSGEWENCVLISDDISQGIVPIDTEMRAWREATGRLLNSLSHRAVHVHRVFLGIGQVIK